MPNELIFSVCTYVLITTLTIFYGILQWYRNFWLREGLLHMSGMPAVRLGTLAGQGRAPDTNLLKQAHDKFRDANVPFCGVGFYRWRRAVVLNFDYYLERLVLKPNFDYYAQGCTTMEDKLHDYWLRRHFYMPADGWGVLRSKLTSAFLNGNLAGLLPHVWQLAEQELIAAVEARLAKANDQTLNLLELQDLCARYIVDVTAKCLFNLQARAMNIDGDDEYTQIYAQILLILRMHKPVDNIWQQWLPIECLDFWHKHRLHLCTFNFCKDKLPQLCPKERGERNGIYDLLRSLNTAKSSKFHVTKATVRDSTNAQLLFAGALARSLANMTLTLYELARHQNTQNELREEICANYSNRYKFGALEERACLETIISETQRCYCTVPRCLLKTSCRDYDTHNPNYRLYKGTVFLVSPQDNCYYNTLYPNPSVWDADRFAVVELMFSLNQLIRQYCGQEEKTDLDELQTSVGIMTLLKHFKFTQSNEVDTQLQFDDSVPFLLLQNAPNIKITRI